MPLRVHVDVVSAEELIFSGETDFAVFRAGRANWASIRGIRRCSPALGRGPCASRFRIEVRTRRCLGRHPRGATDADHAARRHGVRAHDLDEAKSIEARKHAEEMLKNRDADVSYATAEAELAQAVAQLATIKRLRHHKH